MTRSKRSREKETEEQQETSFVIQEDERRPVRKRNKIKKRTHRHIHRHRERDKENDYSLLVHFSLLFSVMSISPKLFTIASLLLPRHCCCFPSWGGAEGAGSPKKGRGRKKELHESGKTNKPQRKKGKAKERKERKRRQTEKHAKIALKQTSVYITSAHTTHSITNSSEKEAHRHTCETKTRKAKARGRWVPLWEGKGGVFQAEANNKQKSRETTRSLEDDSDRRARKGRGKRRGNERATTHMHTYIHTYPHTCTRAHTCTRVLKQPQQ